MVPISGFTIVRNAVKLDFPVVESIRSLLPVCEEFVVNVGKSEDDTLDLIRSIGDPRSGSWNPSGTGAQDPGTGPGDSTRDGGVPLPWGIYIQADEVLGEGARGSFSERSRRWMATGAWRACCSSTCISTATSARLPPIAAGTSARSAAFDLAPEFDVRPYLDAQGFRVGPGNRRIRVRTRAP